MHQNEAIGAFEFMPMAHFDATKAVAATAYLVEHTGESLYIVMKMMYLADKLHLERYGRFIAGDTYAAMKKGPVPSSTYDLFKHVRGECGPIPGGELARSVFEYGQGHALRVLQRPDYDELSESDIECLEATIGVWRNLGKWAVRDLSHDDAWGVSRDRLPEHANSGPMFIEDIASQFDDDGLVLRHVQDPHPGQA